MFGEVPFRKSAGYKVYLLLAYAINPLYFYDKRGYDRRDARCEKLQSPRNTSAVLLVANTPL